MPKNAAGAKNKETGYDCHLANRTFNAKFRLIRYKKVLKCVFSVLSQEIWPGRTSPK